MSSNVERLAAAVRDRRAELDMTQLDVWNAGGPSNTTLTAVENGTITTLSRVTARRLDVGLRWAPGSAVKVWRGDGEPSSVGGDPQNAGYVSAPGPVDPDGISNAEVLAELRAVREELRALRERVEGE